MIVTPRKNCPPDLLPVRRALISVYDKRGLAEFASGLHLAGVEILSTGGTAKTLVELGIPVRDVSDCTGFPEILGGRVKTLHPSVHAALLALRDDPDHIAEMKEHKLSFIDLLVVNLYPFEQARSLSVDYGSIVENIDIGGPAMIRAAAKNHAYVSVVTDVEDYFSVLEALQSGEGSLSYSFRRTLASKAFSRTAAYDAFISDWFNETLGVRHPAWRSFAGKLSSVMRYGENPHQSGALYLTGNDRPGVATARQIQGKQLSWNNINDADAAFELVAEFLPTRSAAVVIVKHANPCGVAQSTTLVDAWRNALACDLVSAFGGVVALNRELDSETAEEIVKIFVEVVIAPSVTEEAMGIFSAKKNIRLLVTGQLPDPAEMGVLVRSVSGGLLVQSRDHEIVDSLDLKVVTRRMPTPAELDDLLFAFRVTKHVKSNGIVYARNGVTIGIGAGQTSRVDSARIAGEKITRFEKISGLSEASSLPFVVASDGFFPFADGLLSAVEAGASAIIQPGGSIRDDEVISAADAHDIAMIFTGIRHFRH